VTGCSLNPPGLAPATLLSSRPPIARPASLDFAEAIEQLLVHLAAERGLSDNYQRLTERSLTKFAEFAAANYPDKCLRTVRIEQLTDYLAIEHRRGMAPASIKTDVAAFRLFFRFLKARGLCKQDPAELLRLPKVPQHLPHVLTEPEVNQLLGVDFALRPLAGRRNRTLPLRDRAILELLYASAIRNAELADARLPHLDLDSRTLRVTGKGNKTRIVLFGRAAQGALQNYLEVERKARNRLAKSLADREMIFLSWNGRRLTTVRVWQLIKESAALAGIKKAVYPHLLRHSCATHMLRRGSDLRVLQELLGHSYLSTTAVYTHLTIEDLKAVHKRCHPRP
jgi:integrase/recombinase XerD